MARQKAERAQSWEPLFRDFIAHLSIDSKESGISTLGENLYDAQDRFLEQVCEGLDRGIRHFVCLKARQLGITTISLAMDLFWLYVHPGMQGGLVTDDEGNREKFRIILERYINSLPKGYRVGIKKHNRHSLVLNNGSVLDYLVAGKKRKTGGTGVSRAFNFLHATEVSNYGDPDAISDLVATLAQTHPDRMYIFESTARGFNGFWDMWQDANTDTHTQKPFFIGWWAKDIYEIPKTSSQYKEYWDGNLSDDERERVNLVRKKYGVKMRSSQIAWYRWMQAVKIPSADKMMQEYPWTEEEAFVATGQTFFHQRRVAQDIQFITDANNGLVFKGYRYHMGKDFGATEIEQVHNPALAELRVWEEPHPNGIYAIGMDPAYGRSDHKDRHSIEVWRCYADCVRQVAEYATDIPETYQAAWVLCHLAGTYKDCMINLEINGPGAVIMNELRTLRLLIDSPGYKEEFEKRGMADVFNAVRWFLYHRPDTMGSGYVLSWKCLALDTRLPTPTGWTTMGEIREGEYLLDETGKPTKVLGCSPVQIGSPCYRLTFDDGTQIVADENHLWKVWRNHWRGIDKIRKTSQLVAGKFCIRRAAALQLPSCELPIDPYVLGVWLGDGYSAGGRFCSSAADMAEISSHLEACGESLSPIATQKTCQARTILGLRGRLVKSGLLGNKHIPVAYLRASHYQRLSLLQGLMDTDGHVRKNGSGCTFEISSERLVVGFSELLRSLGIKAKFLKRTRTVAYKDNQVSCSASYLFWFTARGTDLFRMERKASRLRQPAPETSRTAHHRLISIEQINSVPVRCVKVESASHLFLAGDGMIPTHNTTQDNKLVLLNEYRDAYATGQLGIRSMPLLEEMQTIVQDGGTIEANGRSKDDRFFASALAVKAWKEWLRPSLLAENRIFKMVQQEEERERSREGQQVNFVGSIVGDFFKNKEIEREERVIQRMWSNPDFIGVEVPWTK